MNRFTDMYMCEFTISESEQQLRTIAEQYIRETEAYDRTVCTGPIACGSIIPATNRERALISRNAQELMGSLCQRHAQFTRTEIRQAVQELERTGFTA